MYVYFDFFLHENNHYYLFLGHLEKIRIIFQNLVVTLKIKFQS